MRPRSGALTLDGDRRERVVIALAAATRFASGILMGTGMAFYVGANGGSNLAVGLVATAYYLGMMLFAPFWGAVADVTGRRRAVLVVTGVAATLATLPLVVARGVWLPIGLRGVYAVFAAGFPPVMLAIVSDRGGDASRGRSLGFFNSARAVGFSGGQLGVGLLLGLLAPAGLYAVIAGVSLVSTVAVALVADPRERPAGGASATELVAAVRDRLLPAPEDRAHLRRNGLRWLYVALALRNVTVLGVIGLAPAFLPGRLGFSEFQMGALLALNPAGQAVFMVLFGRVADAAGRKSLITLGMAGSAGFPLVLAGATLPSTVPGRIAVAALAFLLIAASFSAMTAGALAFIGDLAPTDRKSELMGLRSTAKGVGGVVGPVLVGSLATLATYRVAFLAASLLTVLATLLAGGLLTESLDAGYGTAAHGDD